MGLRVSFLRKKENQPFLKKGIELDKGLLGKPLNDFISLKSNELDGMLFNKTTLPAISESFYNLLLESSIDIKNNKCKLYVYTLCKLDNIVLLLVWQINTEICYEDRNSWEKSYKLIPGECCKKTYIFSLLDHLHDNNVFQEGDTLLGLGEKHCKYKKPYIKCTTTVSSYFFNYQDLKAAKNFQECFFGIPINMDGKINPFGQEVLFSYGGQKNTSQLLCTSLYDSIILDKTRGELREHNLKNFLSDSLYTCFEYQNNIAKDKKIEQFLLYMSVYSN